MLHLEHSHGSLREAIKRVGILADYLLHVSKLQFNQPRLSTTAHPTVMAQITCS
jgi:hypothetical protein